MRHLQSLNFSLDVLERLGESHEPLGVTQIASALSLNKATVHAILTNLEARGYVMQVSETARYQLWTRAWQLGALAERQIHLKTLARPFLEELTARTGEGSLLSLYSTAGMVMYLDSVPSPDPVRAYVETGAIVPCYCVATGKVLLAHQPQQEIDSVLARLAKHTVHTVTDPAALASQLRGVREQGWAMNLGEYRDNVIGIAAPILNTRRVAIAAIGVSGPAYRITEERLPEIRTAVIHVAASLSAQVA